MGNSTLDIRNNIKIKFLELCEKIMKFSGDDKDYTDIKNSINEIYGNLYLNNVLERRSNNQFYLYEMIRKFCESIKYILHGLYIERDYRNVKVIAHIYLVLIEIDEIFNNTYEENTKESTDELNLYFKLNVHLNIMYNFISYDFSIINTSDNIVRLIRHINECLTVWLVLKSTPKINWDIKVFKELDHYNNNKIRLQRNHEKQIYFNGILTSEEDYKKGLEKEIEDFEVYYNELKKIYINKVCETLNISKEKLYNDNNSESFIDKNSLKWLSRKDILKNETCRDYIYNVLILHKYPIAGSRMYDIQQFALENIEGYIILENKYEFHRSVHLNFENLTYSTPLIVSHQHHENILKYLLSYKENLSVYLKLLTRN